jgi:hypothetical protein
MSFTALKGGGVGAGVLDALLPTERERVGVLDGDGVSVWALRGGSEGAVVARERASAAEATRLGTGSRDADQDKDSCSAENEITSLAIDSPAVGGRGKGERNGERQRRA